MGHYTVIDVDGNEFHKEKVSKGKRWSNILL